VKFAHVALNCRDIEVTQAFYLQHFGFRVARVLALEGNDKIVFLKRDDVYLELFGSEVQVNRPFPDGHHAQGIVRHIAFQVDSVDAVLTTMGEAAKITLGPLEFDAFIPGWKTVWLEDPDGTIVELSQGYQDE
jgi:glyoxylase I family protein